MFKFILYSIQVIFSWDSKFISSLEKWTSKDFMNIVIDDSLNRWHLRNFIKSHKNKVTFNDCLEHSHKMRIQEYHFAKQSFTCMIKSISFDLCSRIFKARRLITWRVKELAFCWTVIVIDSSQAYMNLENMLSVLKSSMKYRDQTWYYRVKCDRNITSTDVAAIDNFSFDKMVVSKEKQLALIRKIHNQLTVNYLDIRRTMKIIQWFFT